MTSARVARATALALALILAACGASAPATPDSVAPPPSSAVPSPSPTASVDALIEGLRAFAEDGTPYHLEMSGDMNLRPLTGTVTASVDQSGGDSDSRITIELGGQTVTVDSVLVGDTAYVRVGETDWQTVDADALDESANPLAAILAATDIRYRGVVQDPDGALHHLRLLDAVALDPSTLTGVGDVVIRAQALELFVDDAGIPDHATFTLDGTAKLQNGRSVPMFIDVDYTFSRIGEPVEIEAPV